MASLYPAPKTQFFASDGTLAVGYKVYTYVSDGTFSTLKDTYSDTIGTANTNPIILNSRGEATIFWDGVYDVKLTTDADVLVWTQTKVGYGFNDSAYISYTPPDGSATTLSLYLDSQTYPSIADAAAADNTGINIVTTKAYYGGWAATILGPKGGAVYHRDGTTGTASTIYTNKSGFFDANGDGFSADFSSQGFIDICQFGAIGDGASGVEDTAAWTACSDYCNNVAAYPIFFNGVSFLIGSTFDAYSGLRFYGRGLGFSVGAPSGGQPYTEIVVTTEAPLFQGPALSNASGDYVKENIARDISIRHSISTVTDAESLSILNGAFTDLKWDNVFIYWPNASALNIELGWDSELTRIDVQEGGVPNGKAAINITNGALKGQNQTKISLSRFEGLTGPAINFEGSNNIVSHTKFHGGFNTGGTNGDIVSLGRNSIFADNQVENLYGDTSLYRSFLKLGLASIVGDNVARNCDAANIRMIDCSWGAGFPSYIGGNTGDWSINGDSGADSPVEVSPDNLRYVDPSFPHTLNGSTYYGISPLVNGTNVEAIIGVNGGSATVNALLYNGGTGSTLDDTALANGQDNAPLLHTVQNANSSVGILAEHKRTGPAARYTTWANGSTASLVDAYNDANNDGAGRNLIYKLTAAGNVTADGSFTGGGADYAELYESQDGSSLEIGISVAWSGDGLKVIPADKNTPKRKICGVTRSKNGGSTIIGNNDLGGWHKRWLTDKFGGKIYTRKKIADWKDGEEYYSAEVTDDAVIPEEAVITEVDFLTPNPEYDPARKHESRLDRDEYNCVSRTGIVVLKKGCPTRDSWEYISDIDDEYEYWDIR